MAQIFGKSCGRLCAELAAEHSGKQRNYSCTDHDNTVAQHSLAVPGFKAGTEPSDNQRNEYLHGNLYDHKYRCQYGFALVFSQTFCKLSDHTCMTLLVI